MAGFSFASIGNGILDDSVIPDHQPNPAYALTKCYNRKDGYGLMIWEIVEKCHEKGGVYQRTVCGARDSLSRRAPDC